MYQLASALEWRGRIFLHPDSKTTQGLTILTEPISSADPNDPAGLGRAILSALAHSKQGVAHPSIWTKIDAPLLKFAGAKRSGAFYGSARRVSIKRQDDHVTFTPWRNLGPRGGYRTMAEKERTSPAQAQMLGPALLAAFEDTE